jgi:NAD+ synthase
MIAGLTIAIAQVNPVVGNIDYNLWLVKRALEECKDADIVVFPELVVSAYSPEDLILKKSFVQQCMDAAKKFILSCKDTPAFILTTPWLNGGDTYNAALFVEKGEIKSIIYKNSLPNYGVFDERRVFKAGPLPEPVEFKGRKIGILICEDIWFDECAKHLKSRGAEIILSPNGSPYSMTKRERRLEIARDRVRDTGIPLVYVNQIGGQDDIVYDGGSFVLDETGRVAFQAPYCETYIGPIGKSAVEPAQEQGAYDVLKLALKDYIGKNSFSGVILGMSGGIDSALSAAIAVDALGADKVRCVMLPSPFTSNESLEDAEACCKALGCSYEVISINPSMEAFENTLPGLSGLSHENMQSRARGVILMSLSNQTGAMVLTTGNKSEIAMGYATLYGDMCGGYNVLKDVYKTYVYTLAQWRNTLSPVIPERIITKAPSAELRANQTDQDSLPPYDTLDAILDGLIERDLGVDDLVAEGYAKDLVLKVNRLLDLAEYKRRQSAPGPKISTRAFGRERRYPITNGYRLVVEKA